MLLSWLDSYFFSFDGTALVSILEVESTTEFDVKMNFRYDDSLRRCLLF